MIVRPRPHWFGMLFVVRGSVLPKLRSRLILMFCIALLALAGTRYLPNPVLLELNPQPFTLLGIAMAIFLGFRTNVSYERYWEGRKLWGSALNASRSLARQALSLTRWPADSPEARRLVLALAAYAHALRHQLRGTDATVDLQRLLPSQDQAGVLAMRFKPVAVLQLIAGWLRQARDDNQLAEPLLIALEVNLNNLGEVVGGCERIASTPIPLTFSVMVHRVIYFYCTLLPFALTASLGLYTPLFTVFVAYTFMAIEAIAEELEAPFGIDPNDLPLQAMSETIEATLRELLGEKVAPAPAPPADYVVL